MTPEPIWKQAYDSDESVIYLLDAELKIVRCNFAWDRFAMRNHGENAVASKVIGTYIMDAVPPDLQNFYRAAYGNVVRFRRHWWHVFDCSSAHLKRIYQMRILPCDDASLLTINTLIEEGPHDSQDQTPVEDYAHDGIVKSCSNCRRVRRLKPPFTWHWVPELLMSGQVLMIFGLCSFCEAYHYHTK